MVVIENSEWDEPVEIFVIRWLPADPYARIDNRSKGAHQYESDALQKPGNTGSMTYAFLLAISVRILISS